MVAQPQRNPWHFSQSSRFLQKQQQGQTHPNTHTCMRSRARIAVKQQTHSPSRRFTAPLLSNSSAVIPNRWVINIESLLLPHAATHGHWDWGAIFSFPFLLLSCLLISARSANICTNWKSNLLVIENANAILRWSWPHIRSCRPA